MAGETKEHTHGETSHGDTHTEVGHAPADHGSGVFPPFDPATFPSQILWFAITFGALYYMMSKFIVPRIGSILETRSERIEQDLAEAGRLKEEADAAIVSYEEALGAAKSSAGEIATAAKDKAKQEADAQTAKIEADLAEKMAAAETRIASIRETAMNEVDAIASETTEALVKSLIGGRVTKKSITDALKSVS